MEEHAHELRGELEGRLATIRAAVSGASSPRVIALESLDPPRVGGFWIPEMISIAGGEDVAGDPGLNPAEVGWGELSSLGAEVVIVMPSGSVWDAEAQAMEHWERIDALGADRVFAVDATSAFSRARTAPGRRGRAALPPAAPGPDGPARQHRLHRAAGAAFQSLARNLNAALRRRSDAPTTEITATSGHRRQLRRQPPRCPSIPRSPATITAAQTAPPTRPPMWPPRLTSGSLSSKMRLNTMRKPMLLGELFSAAPAGDDEGRRRRGRRSRRRRRAVRTSGPLNSERPESAGEAARRSRGRGSAACRAPAPPAGRGRRGRAC